MTAKGRMISGQKRLMSSVVALCEIIFESKRIDVGHCDVFTF